MVQRKRGFLFVQLTLFGDHFVLFFSDTKLPKSMTAKLEVDMISALGNFLVVEYTNSVNVSIDVTLMTSQIYCRFWEKESSKWDQSGCIVSKVYLSKFI